MPVLAIRSEYRCKLCQSPNRYEADELILKRKTVQAYHFSDLRADLQELGVDKATETNVWTHWTKHCRTLEEASDEEIGAASSEAARQLAIAMQDVVPDADNMLETALKIGHLRWQHELAKGELPKFTPEQIRAFIDAKTRRKHNEKADRLIDIQVEAIAQSLAEPVKALDPVTTLSPEKKGDGLLEALARGRNDIEYFWQVFLRRKPHAGQLDFAQHAQATLNILACGNRWGKTTLVPGLHFHAQVYKTGAEHQYVAEGKVDRRKFLECRYHTIHTANEWGQAELAWKEALKFLKESEPLDTLVKQAILSHPPHVEFVYGGVWKFRTLGSDASGIDGDSFYLVTVDEAGWIPDLREKLDNVVRVRVADVRGRICIFGTFKPGVSRDFATLARRAAVYTGAEIDFSHEAGGEGPEAQSVGGLEPVIVRYLRQAGQDVDEVVAAMTDDV